MIEVLEMSALTEKLVGYGCNIDEAMGRFLNNEAFYEKCFGKFLNDAAFAALGPALEQGNVTESFELAHNLKGVSANMGITPISDIIIGLVEELRAGRMPADAMESYRKIMAIKADLDGFMG